MDITVVMPSRGRVRGLSAVLYSLQFLESGKHCVTYVVACDSDDPETIAFCEREQKNVPLAYRVAPRRETLGGLINETAEAVPGDVYLVINDDILCLSPNWDQAIAEAVEKTPHGVFWWKNASQAEVLFPIVTEAWRAAAGGIFTNHYPFWYDDLCLAELWVMTTDAEPIVLDINVLDKPKTITHRMRELLFWQEVYKKTRVLRVRKAYELAEKLGLPRPQCTEHLAKLMDNHMKRVSDEWIASIEKNQGDRCPPDAAYFSAKARAQRMLDELEAA